MIHRLILLLSLLLFIAYPALHGQADAAPKQPEIRVGIWSNQSSVQVSADSAFTLKNAKTNKLLGEFGVKAKVLITMKNGRIFIDGKQTEADQIRVTTAADKAKDASIEVNRKSYRGVIEIRPTASKSGLTVINTLPLEQYLYGIVPEEMPGDWPMEAIKAQAVAARTFALNSMNKHAADGYDVCATTHCQVYGGKSSEKKRTTEAVDSTYGQVILHNGKPITALFHSTAGGGFTENSEAVWGGSYPYLRAVEDYDQSSPYLSWKKEIKPAELAQALARNGYSIGTLQSIELSPLGKAPVAVPDRGMSGRVKMIRFNGTAGSVKLSGSQVRTLLALSSTLFDVKVIIPVDNGIDVKITDSAGDRGLKTIEVNLPPREEQGLLTDKANIDRLSGRKGEIILFTGAGSGHGVGLSQWGAKDMAEQAPKDDTTYFKKILKHYYQSTEIKKMY